MDDFRTSLLTHFDQFKSTLATDAGDWVVKRFVAQDFTFILQEKWRIASDRPGSGNTKNIGSVRDMQALIEGNGPFALHGPKVFDDYWMNYLTEDMARAIDSDIPYHNLDQYWQWRDRANRRGKEKRK